jgi:hypothetical protein
MEFDTSYLLSAVKALETLAKANIAKARAAAVDQQATAEQLAKYGVPDNPHGRDL